MEELQAEKKVNVLLQFGLLSALASTLYLVILYLMGADVMLGPMGFLNWLIPIVFCVIACRKAKMGNGGFLEFREALKISFGIFVLTGIVTSLFNYVLMNFIDKAFAERLAQLSMEKVQQMLEKFGASQDVIEKQVMEVANSNPFSLGKVFQGFMFTCVGYFIIALIIAAIVKKKKPEFAV